MAQELKFTRLDFDSFTARATEATERALAHHPTDCLPLQVNVESNGEDLRVVVGTKRRHEEEITDAIVKEVKQELLGLPLARKTRIELYVVNEGGARVLNSEIKRLKRKPFTPQKVAEEKARVLGFTDDIVGNLVGTTLDGTLTFLSDDSFYFEQKSQNQLRCADSTVSYYQTWYEVQRGGRLIKLPLQLNESCLGLFQHSLNTTLVLQVGRAAKVITLTCAPANTFLKTVWFLDVEAVAAAMKQDTLHLVNAQGRVTIFTWGGATWTELETVHLALPSLVRAVVFGPSDTMCIGTDEGVRVFKERGTHFGDIACGHTQCLAKTDNKLIVATRDSVQVWKF